MQFLKKNYFKKIYQMLLIVKVIIKMDKKFKMKAILTKVYLFLNNDK